MNIKIRNIPIEIELANTSESRQRGLMQRPTLPTNDGMLFVFPDCAPRSFWMKDTYIPLSIAYINEDNQIVNIETMFPFDLSQTPSVEPAKYALEMNQGWFRKNNINVGDVVEGLTEFVIVERVHSRRLLRERDDRLDEGLIREEAQVNMLMRDVDDILDDAIRDAAPEIVRDIREREVDEDIDEFIDGAIHGSWDTRELDYADPPNVGDSTEVMDSGDNEEVTEMYRLGYTWGWSNPNKIEGGEAIPDATRAEMIEYALENFKSRVTEEFVINALEKATDYVKQQLGDVHHLLKKAKDKFGWKFAPILVSIEVVEHAVLPTMLGAIHPLFYGLAAVPTVEILAASALAIAKARMPSTIPAEIPPGHLDWYEEEYRASANENLLRKYVKKLLKEGVEFRTLDSPLTYSRAGNVKRIALCDTSVEEPNPSRDAYFNEYQEMERYGVSGRRLKKPRKGKLVPGVSDDCVIGFLDYHLKAQNSDGSSYWYIDYMKTRGDKGNTGVASKLIDQFYETVVQPGDNVHFGKMMQPQIGHLKDKMAEKYPEINTIGAKYF